jgi:hypothetical protein
MKKTLLIVALMLSSSALAAPLNRTHVPAEAKWLLHVNLEAFANTEMARLIGDQISEKDLKKIDAFASLFGFDLTKDIHGVTIYGSDAAEENATVLLYGQFDKQILLSLLILNEAYGETQYKDSKLYHWLDGKDNKKKIGMFAADNLIVISQSELSVQATADLLAGEITSLDSQNDAPLAALLESSENALVVIAADQLAELNKGKEHTAILQNSKMMAAVVIENNGDMYLSVNLTTKTDEAAMQIEQVLNGIKAFVALKHADQPETISLLNAATLIRDENKLLLNVKYSSLKLLEIIKTKKKAIANIAEQCK